MRFVVALEAEARPLVARWRLALDPSSAEYRVYRRDDAALIVSGPGKVAAAAAVAHLQAACGGGTVAWLNVGIAGHGERPRGDAILAGRILDLASGRSWYPPQVFEPPLPLDEVVTVDRVEREFAGAGAHEMEAGGFYPIACRYSSAELAQCVKVISDGPGDVPEHLTARRVSELMAARLEPIEEVAETLRELAHEIGSRSPPPPAYESLLEDRHFTVTQSRQLRRLLERWQVLLPGEELPWADLEACRGGREVLRFLRQELDALTPEIGVGSGG